MKNPVHDSPGPPAGDEKLGYFAPMDGKRVSLEEYWERWYEDEGRYEWNNGILEAKPMPNLAESNVFVWFMKLMDFFVESNPGHHIISLDTGFELNVPDLDLPGQGKTTIRKPDFAVICPDNPVEMKDDHRSYYGTFDICVECVSDSGKRAVERDTVMKLAEYQAAKVREYYIIDPKSDDSNAQFFHLDKKGEFVELTPDREGIIYSVELPGFRFRRAHLIERPTFGALFEDDVYDFITPEVKEKHRAEVEEKEREIKKERAAKEKERAAKEKERAAKEKERAAKEKERVAKEKERAEREKAQAEKEKAIAEAERERTEKEAALAEIERLKEELNRRAVE